MTPVVGLPLGLIEATFQAVHDWHYESARRNDEPVPVFYDLTTNFRLVGGTP